MWARRLLTASFALTLVGYLSSFVSGSASEQAAADRVADALGEREVFVLTTDGSSPIEYPDATAILARSDFKIRNCDESRVPFDCFPWAGVSTAKVVGPFVVEVRWGYEGGGLSGLGIRTRYLALFGLVLPIRDLDEWVS
jgi:hypothetical protein